MLHCTRVAIALRITFPLCDRLSFIRWGGFFPCLAPLAMAAWVPTPDGGQSVFNDYLNKHWNPDRRVLVVPCRVKGLGIRGGSRTVSAKSSPSFPLHPRRRGFQVSFGHKDRASLVHNSLDAWKTNHPDTINGMCLFLPAYCSK